MNKSQLIKNLAEKEDLTLRQAETVVNTFFDSITETLVKGDRVEVRGFGSFAVKTYDGYAGRNPKTGEPIIVAPKKLPAFKVGKELKQLVDTDSN